MQGGTELKRDDTKSCHAKEDGRGKILERKRLVSKSDLRSPSICFHDSEVNFFSSSPPSPSSSSLFHIPGVTLLITPLIHISYREALRE